MSIPGAYKKIANPEVRYVVLQAAGVALGALTPLP
jgi:hypothetical protein